MHMIQRVAEHNNCNLHVAMIRYVKDSMSVLCMFANHTISKSRLWDIWAKVRTCITHWQSRYHLLMLQAVTAS